MFGLISRFFQARAPRSDLPTDPRVLQAFEFIEAGQLDKAEHLCTKIITAEPRNAEAYNMLGRVAVQRGKNELAVRHLSKAIAINPNEPGFRHGMGIALFNAGKLLEAVACFQQALALDPKKPAAHYELGNCHRREGDLDAAAACYRAALAADRKYMAAYVSLAGVLRQQGEFKSAMAICRKALRIDAGAPDIQFQLAMALCQVGRFEEAVPMLQAIAADHPDFPEVHHELGLALGKLGKAEQAIGHLREAVARQPSFAVAHNSLAVALLSRNDTDGAMASFRKALALKPDFARVHSNLLMTMNYQAGWTQKRLYQESLQFESRQARKLLQKPPVFSNPRDKKKVLKIGYVSPDFRGHSVAYFTKNLLGSHDRERFEVFAYAEVEKPDAFTSQFEAQADHWLSTVGMEDADVAEAVRQNEIDILVDVAGHTSNNRLLVFARKPAPVQVTWLGYPNTTGMRTIDYRLTDSIADPPGEADSLHSEKLVRLEHGFLCFQADDSSPEVSPPPCLKQGHITIGTFNTTKKITSEVISVWSHVLQSIPGARLLLKSDSLDDDMTKARLLKMFAQQAIAPDRLDLLSAVPGTSEHLGLYSRVDIAVDPFPYNGTTTTCEALWMGVPVVTLRGDRHAGRVGASILEHVGLPELIADSKEKYVELVRSLAGDTERLTSLRNQLRPQMQRSSLMDVRMFTDALENAYRGMWITWCDSKG